MKLALSAVLIFLLGCVVGSIDYRAAKAMELDLTLAYEDLDEAHAALELFTRNEGSCAVRDGGPRIFCWMVNGTVYRRELEPGEYVAVKSARRTER